jgi:hypothetical protein
MIAGMEVQLSKLRPNPVIKDVGKSLKRKKERKKG